ncbi:NnrS family protein [Antarcticimicrobium luteum]|uniref:NnrS family protein n=1 Tax=Antarcticimicrobium luteum TaxID=2547397 RepID=A0A4R5UTC8_9RHOB|nr:NnrS family protein [Antarcticimicrobium luteum]TDK42399.1 NnrS family protein [Antarcticimicrobium luteum]
MTRSDYDGPALFSYGFRPFFLFATAFAFGVVPVWLLIWRGTLLLEGPFLPVAWHVHEMIFGYGAAVVAGFLFTAVPNWTGRMPTRGWPLMLLLALWLLGRVACAGLLGLPAMVVMGLDVAFLVAVAAMIAREILAGRSSRNLKVLVPVTVLTAANVLYHVEAMQSGTAPYAERAGIATLVFLITLIGGRIVPSFTRNWLVQSGSPARPVPFGTFDAVALVAGAGALILWTVLPGSDVTGGILALAAGLHLVRMLRWLGVLTLGAPLLCMLHVAYAFIPVGFAAASLAAFGLAGQAAPQHLLGIGAIGGMTLAVMVRATLGHTGRDLISGPALNLAFLAIAGAALMRVAGMSEVFPGLDGIHLAAGLWTLGFGVALRHLMPWLTRPRVQPRKPSRAARRA